jgi:uncharacterized secreted protein with C-terminal beta-propeller domain
MSRQRSMLTPAEASELLDVSQQALCRLLDRGLLPFQTASGDQRISLVDVASYAARREAGRRDLAEVFASAESDRHALLSDTDLTDVPK